MSKTIVAAHQPNFMPYLGFFDKLEKADLFVIRDEVSFTKRDYHHRNKIRINGCDNMHNPQSTWIGVPVVEEQKHLRHIKIKQDAMRGKRPWKQQLAYDLTTHYEHAPHFEKHFPNVMAIVEHAQQSLCDMNMQLIAYICFPVYEKIRRKITYKPVAIILSLVFVSIIIIIPFLILAIGIGQQGYLFYNSLTDSVAKGALFGFSCDSESSTVCLLLNQAESFSLNQLSRFGIDQQLDIYLPILEDNITAIALTIPLIIAKIFITLVITYFILKDYKTIIRKVSNILPVKASVKERLVREFADITHTVIYAQLFVAFVQGAVGTLGFYLFGVPFPILLGVLIAFFALIPFIGTSLIWIPAALYLILSGYFTQDYWLLAKGIGLLLYGLLIIAPIDNILLAKIVTKKANVSPIVVIVGVIGGATMFGVIGIFLGPIILPLLITYLQTFKEGLYSNV